MSTSRHHSEWLSLLEISGPFLSLPVLMQAFPQGLDAHDPEMLKLLKQAYEEWEYNKESDKPDAAIHRAWVKFILSEALGLTDDLLLEGQSIPVGLHTSMPEYGETIRPDWALTNNDGSLRFLIQLYPSNQSLDRQVAGSHWIASPETRMMELLHASKVRLGLVTNGSQWMLVNAPIGETTGFISWYAHLWIEEHLTLQSFRSLLAVRRFLGVEDSQTLESLLAQSAMDQQEVTDRLGQQVRSAVEVLVQELDQIDRDRKHTLLKEVSETELYESVLTVMMRLVFLFSAEERGMLMLKDELYDQYYAVSTLRDQLRKQADQHGEEVLENRADAWCRLLAIFRAVHGGVKHDLLEIPAYGGSLFDPDRFPFLEGRRVGTRWRETISEPIPVSNRIVLHLLQALQFLQVKATSGPTEMRRLSFRSLDIEQIGHVYEGLLDHTAVRATTTILGLEGTKTQEPEISLEQLEKWRAKGEAELNNKLKEETGRTEASIKKSLELGKGKTEKTDQRDLERLLSVCGNDKKLWTRVQPFAGLLRKDTKGYPVVILEGSVYVTQGDDRRTTGTHYTPRSLTEEIVRYTLEPLVYEGVAEGKPRGEWKLKTAAELLSLKICDIAMGSGAFLVQACRYLADRLVEAWEEVERISEGEIVVAPEGTVSEARPEELPIPNDPAERLIVAKRIVADRCLYGVDKNPMAVEMAKLSLWLITMQKNRPFTFLDHALKCGDSLLGITDLKQLENFDLNPESECQLPLVPTFYKPLLNTAIAKRLELESFSVDKTDDLTRKEQLLKEAEAELDKVRIIGDVLIGGVLNQLNKVKKNTADLSVLSEKVTELLASTDPVKDKMVGSIKEMAKELLGNRKPFHWSLEYPEVFAENGSGGFSALIGNPPFLGGKKISGPLGSDYREYLVKQLAKGAKGNADLCAYFFLRSEQLLKSQGHFGLVATNTIAQGDTREVGLDQLVAKEGLIYRAIPSRPWPGEASLEIAEIWMRNGNHWNGEIVLNDSPVKGITQYLTVPGQTVGNPHRLAANQGKSFIGSYVLGMGFVLTPEEAHALIEKDPRNKDVLFPYLNGEDLNSRPDQSPSRWVINFFDWPLDRKSAPKDYDGPVAADYPDCLKIVKEKVKPERDKLGLKSDSSAKGYAKLWWLYGRRSKELYSTIAGMERVLLRAQVSKTHAPIFATPNQVFSMMCIVFPLSEWFHFSVLQTTLHEIWVNEYSSSLKGDQRYTPTDCFDTFPFPQYVDEVNIAGERYYTFRNQLMSKRNEGLTKIYNKYHDKKEVSCEINQLRELHIEMDKVVTNAYGWDDIKLEHNFISTKKGMRFTISEKARHELLDRLLQLNLEQYTEEVKSGLHSSNNNNKKLRVK